MFPFSDYQKTDGKIKMIFLNQICFSMSTVLSIDIEPELMNKNEFEWRSTSKKQQFLQFLDYQDSDANVKEKHFIINSTSKSLKRFLKAQ